MVRAIEVFRPLAELENGAWREAVEAYLAADVDSDGTRRIYRSHLLEALTFLLGESGSLGDLDGAQLASWRARVTSSPLAPSSQAVRLAALRSFLRWSGAMGWHQLDGVVRTALRTPRAEVKRPYSVLTEPEMAAVLAAATSARDRAILAVLLGGGLRAAELVALDVTDLVEEHEGGSALWVRQGKRRKDRIVPIQEDVAGAVRAYLEEGGRRLGDPGPLFLAHDRGSHSRGPGRLTTRSIGQLVDRLAGAAGITAKRISPHSLRHTFALRTLRHGGNVVAVSKLLGHSSITTTTRYTDHLEHSELRAAIPALPVARKRKR